MKAVAVGSLGNHLKASPSQSPRVVKEWLELQMVRGTEAPLVALSIGEDAEEFARVWDEAQQALAKNAVASVDNLVKWVSTHEEDPTTTLGTCRYCSNEGAM